jgi:2-C-methyl-D-erythritol 2,4-cyclodiphosphate synthase
MIRIGYGYDVHRLEAGLPLFIGGVKLEHTKGCVAHSDGDVLIHAICDALLGAADMRDIGYQFPDTSLEYKGIDSKKLLAEVCLMLEKSGWEICNIDSTVCLEKPKLNPSVAGMKKAMAQAAGITESQISVKATTSEKLGFVGTEQGVSAHAVALIQKSGQKL